jgi:uncharacterized protein YndB with AHSA1/START domain
MTTNHKTLVIKNLQEKSILVSCTFNAPMANVWRAYTESEFLDQWWGPAPWRAETKSLDFKPGGHWLYAMIGPEGEKHWARMNYITIKPYEYFEMEDVFCDENGNTNANLPVSTGRMVFTETSNGTLVEYKMIYSMEEDVLKIIEMGFEEGITICLEQLQGLIDQNKI